MAKFRISKTSHGFWVVEKRNFLGFWYEVAMIDEYFKMLYPSKDAAMKAVEGYNNRYTYYNGDSK